MSDFLPNGLHPSLQLIHGGRLSASEVNGIPVPNEQIRVWQIARRGTFTKSEREALERVCAERGIR